VVNAKLLDAPDPCIIDVAGGETAGAHLQAYLRRGRSFAGHAGTIRGPARLRHQSRNSGGLHHTSSGKFMH
jgi:hypothetical protein